MAHILIADDLDAIRSILRYLLESHGHSISEARDGRQALRLAGEESFDLFICDLFMPKGDGTQAIGEFRRAFPALPIIATSGGLFEETPDVLSVAIEAGADRAIPKPFNFAALLSAVNELLEPSLGLVAQDEK